MSTPPKEPKPGAGSSLEHTFLGVAPAAPEPASTPPVTPQTPIASNSAAPGGSAIIAAPMISVSGERKAQPATAAQPAAPARPTALQGGWQSAGVARPSAPDQTALQGTPGAWPMPPAPAANATLPPARALPPRPESSRPAATPAAVNPRLAGPAAQSSGAGLHHTALASDYLRDAREVALASGATPAAPRVVTPALPSVERLAVQAPPAQPPYAPAQVQPQYAPAQPQQHYAASLAPQPHEPAGPPTQVPVSEPAFPSAAAAPASPAVTAGPPATAPLSDPIPVPYASPAYQPALVYAREPEATHGPRSIGTQASVAPPPSGAPVVPGPSPIAAFAPQVALAPAPSPVRNAPLNPMAGTMLDRTPSVPGSALPAAPAFGHTHAGGSSTRFEQVPSARGSLGQQATGFGLHIPIDQSATDWGRTGHESAAGKTQKPPSSQLRLVLLAGLAVVAIGFAVFGKQLLALTRVAGGARVELEGQRSAATDSRSPDQATLTNLPSSAAAPAPSSAAAGVTPGAVHAAAPAPTVPALAVPAPATTPAPAQLPSVPAQASPEQTSDPAAGKALDGAEGAATPESRLAAQAGRHVLAARFAEALPLYRQLQQSFPQNTAYAAMARVLEQKTAASGKPGAQP